MKKHLNRIRYPDYFNTVIQCEKKSQNKKIYPVLELKDLKKKLLNRDFCVGGLGLISTNPSHVIQYLRVVQTKCILFSKSMSERVGSDIERP